MITDDRSRRVAEIARRKAELLRRESGPGADRPCARCLHYDPGKWSWLLPFTARCNHPVFVDYALNRVSGSLVGKSRITPARARKAGSLCGPDAFLFEERSRWRRFKIWLSQKIKGSPPDPGEAPSLPSTSE